MISPRPCIRCAGVTRAWTTHPTCGWRTAWGRTSRPTDPVGRHRWDGCWIGTEFPSSTKCPRWFTTAGGFRVWRPDFTSADLSATLIVEYAGMPDKPGVHGWRALQAACFPCQCNGSPTLFCISDEISKAVHGRANVSRRRLIVSGVPCRVIVMEVRSCPIVLRTSYRSRGR